MGEKKPVCMGKGIFFLNFFLVIVFIGIILFLSRKFHIYWLDQQENLDGDTRARGKVKNRKIRVALGLLGFVILLAYIFNVEFAIAAFFAGIYVSQTTRLKREEMIKLNSIGWGLLIPIFFFVMGAQINMAHFFSSNILYQVAVILIISFFTQVTLTALSSLMVDFPLKESILVGIGLSACSLSGGFAVLTIGNQAGVVISTTYSFFAAIITLSVIMTVV